MAVELAIVDVGHGNTTIVRDGSNTVMIDCALSGAVYEELVRTGVNRLRHLVISHSDTDHMRGAARLIAFGLSVEVISANADSAKDTKAWKDFRVLVQEEIEAGRSKLAGVYSGNVHELETDNVRYEVLHPDAGLALQGPTSGRRRRSSKVTQNDCSAVLRVVVRGAPLALLAGDLTRTSFDRMRGRSVNMEAPVLVFPHHGGRSGSPNDARFARELCEAVKPEYVVFSHGRNSGYGTPQPEIVAGVREFSASVRILCTQLGKACEPENLIPRPRHLGIRPAEGAKSASCCAGTVVFSFDPAGVLVGAPSFADHQDFIRSFSKPQCWVGV